MTTTQGSKRVPLGVLAIAAISSVLATLASPASAQVSHPALAPHLVQVAEISLADLEEAFWVCDYVATTKGVSDGLVSVCGAAYDELKQRKFGGDSDHLVRWWQQNKPKQHARLHALDQARQ